MASSVELLDLARASQKASEEFVTHQDRVGARLAYIQERVTKYKERTKEEMRFVYTHCTLHD